jgi:hypothetical protein
LAISNQNSIIIDIKELVKVYLVYFNIDKNKAKKKISFLSVIYFTPNLNNKINE